MNKTIVSAFLLVAIATTSASAKDVPKISNTISASQEKNRVEIDQLLDAVKKKLGTKTNKT
jgi:hypothetical protein